MGPNENILELVREKEAEAIKQTQRAVILQPGAIGDCILTLRLSKFMKESLELSEIDLVGNTEYTGILPGRTCIDRVRSIESVDMYKLFTSSKEFDLADRDALINFFAEYSWIVTFLGEPNSDFEQNLIFTANCSHSAEVVTVSSKPSKRFGGHISDFYIRQFIRQCGLSIKAGQGRGDEVLIKSTESDIDCARALLKEAGIGVCEKAVIIHPGSGSSGKCWHLDNFLAVAKELTSEGLEVIFLLGPAELERFDEGQIRDMRTVGRCLTDLSLAEVLGLLSCAGAFVGNDSGITHLAAGLGVRTVAVFGPSNPVLYKPAGPCVTIVTSKAGDFSGQACPALQQQVSGALL